MTAIALTVNGERIEADIEPRMHLADFLRERLHLTGTHLGCEQGVCGACTILLDGAPARACLTFAVACADAEIRTVEGFGEDATMARLRDAFSAEHALQCGFCTPGMLISAYDIVRRLPGADEARIRRELSGNLCRCTGYVGIVAAVRNVAAAQPTVAPATETETAAPAKPLQRFTVEPPTAAAATVTATSGSTVPPAGWTRIEESFALAVPPDTAWRLFVDLPRIAACVPGAILDEVEGGRLKGRIRVKIGPMTPSFLGTATLQQDESARSGLLEGSGGDEKSNSRARGRLAYRLLPDAGGGTRVALTLDFALQGMLAQFGRSGLVRDVVRRLVEHFSTNLAASFAPSASPPTTPTAPAIATGNLFWQILWSRLKALLRIGS